MKTCIACKHFALNESWCGTAVTGGHSASASCDKNHFYAAEEEIVEVCLTAALACPDFELSDLARSKGWKDES